jgi:hypothetical protein
VSNLSDPKIFAIAPEPAQHPVVCTVCSINPAPVVSMFEDERSPHRVASPTSALHPHVREDENETLENTWFLNSPNLALRPWHSVPYDPNSLLTGLRMFETTEKDVSSLAASVNRVHDFSVQD